MKKKILLSTHTLNIGGVERSFIALLENIDYTKYDVDVFIYQHGGDLFQFLPKEVNCINEISDYKLLLAPVNVAIKNAKWGIAFSKVLARLITKWKNITLKKDSRKNDSIGHVWLYKTANFFLPKITEKSYDACLAFLHPNYFEYSKINAAQYFAWIHTDYSYLNIDIKAEKKMWSHYDHIFGVSNHSVSNFIDVFPELAPKISVFENILSPDFVRQQADTKDVKNEMPKEDGTVTLCSTGRFSYPKNFDNIPFICKKLLDAGCKVKWYLIGYGGDENLIRSKIEEAGMQENVIILGKKENPYPYMKACDIYVQPSRYEGKAVTVREAQILGKPVVITNFATSGSQLRDGVDGIIVPIDNEGCAEGIKSLIENKELQNKLIANCRSSDFGNKNEVEKIYKLIS